MWATFKLSPAAKALCRHLSGQDFAAATQLVQSNARLGTETVSSGLPYLLKRFPSPLQLGRLVGLVGMDRLYFAGGLVYLVLVGYMFSIALLEFLLIGEDTRNLFPTLFATRLPIPVKVAMFVCVVLAGLLWAANVLRHESTAIPKISWPSWPCFTQPRQTSWPFFWRTSRDGICLTTTRGRRWRR